VTIGPRHTIGWSASISRPIELICRPWFSIGSSVRPSVDSGLPEMPSIVGWLGP
jgi:hypothetical protein